MTTNPPSTESFESVANEVLAAYGGQCMGFTVHMLTEEQLFESKRINMGKLIAAAEQTANKRVAAGEEFGMHILAKELIARGADPRFVLGCQSAAKKHPELRMVQSTPPKPKADAGEEG